ncbi:MAG: cell division protein FtsZ [Anaerolineae bacterium]|nr:MAG: cell division protein FtsZ [Anaerolineae bacterium]
MKQPVLKVLGLGGGGCNAINRMIELGLSGVEFIAANTDHQSLATSLAPVKIQLGPKVTRGLGAGGNPEVGNAAARESARELAEALRGADMVFLTAGMGGGTGTGSIAVAAELARRSGAVTTAIVTTPFAFEMGRRQRNASQGLARLTQHTDTLIAIPNDRLLQLQQTAHLSLDVAFRVADDVLRQAVQGITELVTRPGLINVDFAHIRYMFKGGGGAFLALGYGEGRDKALHALHAALHHPLLEGASLDVARGVLVNFTGGSDLTLHEIHAAIADLQSRIPEGTELILGVSQEESMEGRVQCTVVITGLGARPVPLPAVPASTPAAAPVPQKPPQTPRKRPAVSPSPLELEIPAYLRRAALG